MENEQEIFQPGAVAAEGERGARFRE